MNRRFASRLDGSEPTVHSAKFECGLRIDDDCAFGAATFVGSHRASNFAAEKFQWVKPLQPVTTLSPPCPSVLTKEVKGKWSSLPNFDLHGAQLTLPKYEITYDVETTKQNVGRRYEGYLRIHESEMYDLALTPDDGSSLVVGGEVVIDNDGLYPALTKSGRIALSEGLHRIRMDCFNRSGSTVPELQMGKLVEPLMSLSRTMLFH